MYIYVYNRTEYAARDARFIMLQKVDELIMACRAYAAKGSHTYGSVCMDRACMYANVCICM